eukprot:scpid14362/ scgid0364/ Putative DNA repair and recombination protein RAD26-like
MFNMDDDQSYPSQSYPVLAGRYPAKRKIADESYSPHLGGHGQRKRLTAAESPPTGDNAQPSTPALGNSSRAGPDSLGSTCEQNDEKPRMATTPRPSSHSTSSPSTSSASSSPFISSSSTAWKAGDHCMALFDEDGDYYEAVISRVRLRKRQQTAEVVFVGYEDDGHVVVSLDSIRPVEESVTTPKRSPSPGPRLQAANRMFGHGSVDTEQDNYMKQRYGDYEISAHEDPYPPAEDQCEVGKSPSAGHKSPATGSTTSGTKKASKRAVVEVAMVETATTPKRSTAKPSATLRSSVTSPAEIPRRPADSPSVANPIGSWEPDGFTEDDLEKPRFQTSAGCNKTAYMLTGTGVTPAVSIPAPLNQYLRDYQREGAKFLFKHFEQKQGCVLGDDMGLGKTVQVIAFIAAVLGKTNTRFDVQPKFQCFGNARRPETAPAAYSGVFLVVTPASVLYNWEEEIKTWTHLKSRVLHGSQRTEAMELARTGSVDIILTTYDTAKLNLEFVNSIDWLAGVFDEAHRMKDPKSQTTQVMKALRLRRRIGLTGTAMQNSLTELWCLLDWCNPGCLGNKEAFEEDIALPMMTGQRIDSTKRELATSRQKQKQLQAQLSKWFLRRTKALIADQLPKKEEYVVFCPWTELQYSICQALLECDDFQIVLKAHDPCPCSSGRKRSSCCYSENSQGLNWKKLILPYLSLMMKAACHLGLLLPDASDSANQKHKAKAICTQVFAKHRKFLAMSREAAFLTLSDPEYCGKMQVLEKLLRRVKSEGSRVLLFSFRTKILNLLQTFLQQHGYTFCRLDGSVPTRQRTVLVRSFNKDPSIFVFLASKSVGGVGLNITGANVVIIFDPDWNPATDSQAQDRAFRLGQHRDVHVYRLITQGSVEENAYLRQVYKQQMVNIAVSGDLERRHFTAVMGLKRRDSRGRVKGELFSFENMFVIRQESNCLTEDILKRTARVENGILMASDQVSPHIAADNKEDTVKEAETETDLLEELSQAIQDEEEKTTSMPSRVSPRRKAAIASKPPGTAGERLKPRSAIVRSDLIVDDDDAVDGAAEVENKVEINTAASTRKSRNSAPRRTATARVPDTLSSPDSDQDHSAEISAHPPPPAPTRAVNGSRKPAAVELEEPSARKRKRGSQSQEAANAAVSSAVGAKALSAGNLLLGTSRAERRMSRHAMRDVFDKNQLSQQPANCIVDESSDESDDLGERARQQQQHRKPTSVHHSRRSQLPAHAPASSHSEDEQTSAKQVEHQSSSAEAKAVDCVMQEQAKRVRKSDGSHILVGQTPPAVRRQHFERLATLLGFGSCIEFAKKAVECDADQRCRWLELLYGVEKEENAAPSPSERLTADVSSCKPELQLGQQCPVAEGMDMKETSLFGEAQLKSDAQPDAKHRKKPAQHTPPLSEADVLAEDSADSQTYTRSRLVSPLRRQLRFRAPPGHAQSVKTVIPESESLGVRDGSPPPPPSQYTQARTASSSSGEKRPDAEELFASFLSAPVSSAEKRSEPSGSPPAMKAAADQGHATQQPGDADHDLELADMLFG